MTPDGVSLPGPNTSLRPTEVGRWAVFAGYPIGVGIIGGVLLLLVGERAVAAGGQWFSDGLTPLLIFSALLLPFSIAGGTLEGLYGRRIGGLPCCTLVVLGAAAGYLLPLAVARWAGLYEFDATVVAAAAGGLGLQVAAAVAGWALVRRRLSA